ncbi:MAG: shikimate kinase [Candidatus Bathyarchaeia archaeon]
MSAEAAAYGAVTIVNAIATGKGAAFGIDLWTKARVKLTDDGAIETRILDDEEESTLLAERCVRAVFGYFGTSKLGAKVETNSNIPIARGLKSSSVAGNAIVLATLAALHKRLKPDDILDLVVNASLQAKVSVTGAFDDAAASLYGNVVVTDNTTRTVLRTFPVEDYTVLLLVPPEKAYTADADLRQIKTVAKQVEIAHEQALAGKYWNAMTLNGLIYSHVLKLPADVIVESLAAGALAAGISGKGPSYAFVVEEQFKDPVLDVLKRREGGVIVSRTRNQPSFVEPTKEH